MTEVKFHLLHSRAQVPLQATGLSAGYDCFAVLDAPVVLEPGKRALIPLGFAMELPADMEAQIRPRSGLSVRHGIIVVNSPGTIDADYRGEVQVILGNLGDEPFAVEPGMRIAQMVFQRVERPVLIVAEDLEKTARGAGGFGHSGC